MKLSDEPYLSRLRISLGLRPAIFLRIDIILASLQTLVISAPEYPVSFLAIKSHLTLSSTFTSFKLIFSCKTKKNQSCTLVPFYSYCLKIFALTSVKNFTLDPSHNKMSQIFILSIFCVLLLGA